MLVEMPHPVHGKVKLLGMPIKLSGTPGEFRQAPPLLGEHTDEVLREIGYAAEAIAEMRASGAVGPLAGSSAHDSSST
jgi:formyl-CoA transferase